MSLTTAGALQSLLTQRDRDVLLGRLSDRVRFDEPLAACTSWKIGGPADALCTIEDEDELAFVLEHCRARALPWFVIGGGSNLLIGDGGMRGLVLRLSGTFAALAVERDGDTIVVRAGACVSMAAITARAASEGATGIGSLSGIPGTVGGSLRMNAGTDREIGDFVREVWVQTPSRPQPHLVTLEYRYRGSSLPRDTIVSRAVLGFERSDATGVRSEMQQRLVRRKHTQPIALPNAGSCFRNPPGQKAAALIEAAGAKGWREGEAEVSPLHANFVNNLGGATAKDVTTLLARVRHAVSERFGVDLQLEVHLVGVFIDA